MKLLRLNFLYLAVVLTSFFNVSHAEITTHEELINAAINKDENNRLIPAKVPLEHIGVIGYDGSYSLERVANYFPVFRIPNTSKFISKYPDENTLSVVAISDGVVLPARRTGLEVSLTEPGKEAIIAPNIYVYTNSSDLLDTGVFVSLDRRGAGKRATFENEVTVDLPLEDNQHKSEGFGLFYVESVLKKNLYSRAFAGIRQTKSNLLSLANIYINAKEGFIFSLENSLKANTINVQASDVLFHPDNGYYNGNFSLEGKQINLIAPRFAEGFSGSDFVHINVGGQGVLNMHGEYDEEKHAYNPMLIDSYQGKLRLEVGNKESNVSLYFNALNYSFKGEILITNGSRVDTVFHSRNDPGRNFKILVRGGSALNVEAPDSWLVPGDGGSSEYRNSFLPEISLRDSKVVLKSSSLYYYYFTGVSSEKGTVVIPFDAKGRLEKRNEAPYSYGGSARPQEVMFYSPAVAFGWVNTSDKVNIVLNISNFKKEYVEGKSFPLFAALYAGNVQERDLYHHNEPPTYYQTKRTKIDSYLYKFKLVDSQGILHKYSYTLRAAMNKNLLTNDDLFDDYSSKPMVNTENDIGWLDSAYMTYFFLDDIHALKPEIEPTDLVDTLVGLESANLLTLQGFNDTLYDRLGELRLNTRDRSRGLWVRTKLNNAKKSGLFGFDAHSELVDVGFDKTWSWAHGTATAGLTYQWQNLHLKNPHTSLNNHVSSVGMYTSWLTESGWYTDVVARAGKYYTDNAPIHVSDVTGVENRTLQQTSLNNPWIFNASAELGRRISFKNRFFVEPQLQLNYTYMRHRDIELSETIDEYFNRWEGTSDADLSLVGRLGLTLGYTFKGKDEQPVGSAYVRVNYSHEFLGQMGVNIRNVEAGDPEIVEPELSLELPHRYSWWSTDIGVTRQWGKAWSFHGGARWTFKGIADRAWELNFGARYAF